MCVSHACGRSGAGGTTGDDRHRNRAALGSRGASTGTVPPAPVSAPRRQGHPPRDAAPEENRTKPVQAAPLGSGRRRAAEGNPSAGRARHPAEAGADTVSHAWFEPSPSLARLGAQPEEGERERWVAGGSDAGLVDGFQTCLTRSSSLLISFGCFCSLQISRPSVIASRGPCPAWSTPTFGINMFEFAF
jgi:hypothetical protein